MTADFTTARNHNERKRGESERRGLEAVDHASGFVQARTAMRARA